MTRDKCVLNFNIDDDDLNSEEKIKQVLNASSDALPVRAIAIITGLDRRIVYRKLKKLKKYHEVERASARRTEYWKLASGDF